MTVTLPFLSESKRLGRILGITLFLIPSVVALVLFGALSFGMIVGMSWHGVDRSGIALFAQRFALAATAFTVCLAPVAHVLTAKTAFVRFAAVGNDAYLTLRTWIAIEGFFLYVAALAYCWVLVASTQHGNAVAIALKLTRIA